MKRAFTKVSFTTFKQVFIDYPVAIVQKIYDEIKIPMRKTMKSAGYDFISPINVVLEPGDSYIVPTGIKAYMQDNEFLAIFIRSSLGIKKNIILKNGTGIIDADYVDNSSNEGHIMIAIKNIGPEVVNMNAGDAFAQGIFLNYLLTTDDDVTTLRKGGIGSTSENIELVKAKIKDAHDMLKVQKECFKKYLSLYGEFDTNPYYMTLHRMEFNIRYRLGDYQKIMLNNRLIGGIFAFSLDEENKWQIAQLYILPEFEHQGIGSIAIEKMFAMHQDVKEWYADTILQEKHNVEFYQKHGFEIIDVEEEHRGLSFATLVKKIK